MYIVIEGPNGAGKSTQIQQVVQKLQEEGRLVKIISEPDIDSDLTARAIRRITQDPNYRINTKSEVLLFNASRSQTIENIKKTINQGIDCIADRSFLSTLVYQYHNKINKPDYRTLCNIIDFAVDSFYPDLILVLDADPEILHSRVTARSRKDKYDNVKLETIQRLREAYLLEAKSRNIRIINGSNNQTVISAEILAEILYARSLLKDNEKKTPPTNMAAKLLINAETMVVNMTNNNEQAPNENKAYLDKITTDSEGQVYAMTDEISQSLVAAAMARLSRRPGDMRTTFIEEFSDREALKDIAVLRRIISDYGDDSVTQLVGIHLVVEGASNLLTKQLQWGRLAAYLEQSTRYIYYDQKDENDKYLYLRPESMEAKVLGAYETILDKIFDNYSEVVRSTTDFLMTKLTKPDNISDVVWKSAVRAQACDVARSMLPVATKSTVGIFASGQALENMIMRLRASESKEAQKVANNILEEARKVIPVFLERTDKQERGAAYTKYLEDIGHNMQSLTNEILPGSFDSNIEPGPKLGSFFPTNEMDLIPHMLYEYSDISEESLASICQQLSYDDKVKIMETYTGERRNRRHKPGRALERAFYSWDIISDYGTFRDLQRHRIVNDLAWQKLSPRYGYDTPDLITEAGLDEKYQEAFDLSLRLHSLLIDAGYEHEAQYATLLGHRMRWKVTMNAREAMHFMELRTSEQGHPAYRKLVKEMYDQLAERHPLLASSMKFINQKDSPELTRLESEIRSESKRQQSSND